MAYRGNTVRSGITKVVVATYIVYILTVSYDPDDQYNALTNWNSHTDTRHGRDARPTHMSSKLRGSKVMLVAALSARNPFPISEVPLARCCQNKHTA